MEVPTEDQRITPLNASVEITLYKMQAGNEAKSRQRMFVVVDSREVPDWDTIESCELECKRKYVKGYLLNPLRVEQEFEKAKNLNKIEVKPCFVEF